MMIRDFMQAEAAKPFVSAETDCASTCDRWVTLRTGVSPMAVYGRTYSGPQEAEAWLGEFGGLAVAVSRVMRACGFRKTKEPKPGDIGLICHNGRLCAAIHAGEFWFSRDEHGLIGTPLDAVWKAWSI